MSNSMSRSKSRWKAALLATVAGAVVTPLAARAQNSMTVGLTLSPFGSGPQSLRYIDPYDPVKMYVYATVTGASAPSASYVDGLEYLYFNVNAAVTAGATGLGNVSSASLDTNFGGGAFNGSGGTEGAQVGNLSTGTITSTPAILLGDASNMPLMAKPRTNGQPLFNTGSNSSSDVIVHGNSVSFLVETLTYQPNKSAVLGNSSTPTAPNSVSFNISIPSLASQYAPANYFVGLAGVPATGQPVGASNTSSGYSGSTTTVKLTNAIPGDFNLDGNVNGLDLGALANDFGVSSGATYASGDANGDGAVNGLDLGALASQFGAGFNVPPTGPASFAAALAEVEAGNPQFAAAVAASVPEPVSLGLLVMGGSALLGRRRASRA